MNIGRFWELETPVSKLAFVESSPESIWLVTPEPLIIMLFIVRFVSVGVVTAVESAEYTFLYELPAVYFIDEVQLTKYAIPLW